LDNGLHMIVAPRLNPTTSQWQYHAHKISLTGTGPIDLSHLPSWGRFTSQRITDIAVHPNGMVMVLNADEEKVELLELQPQPSSALTDTTPALQIGGQGSYIGLLHGASAITLTRDGDSFLVLEGVNKRIQAFTVKGAVVQYFDGQPYVSVNQGQYPDSSAIQYLGISVEYGGYIYVLSSHGSAPQDFRVDIYDPKGKYLTYFNRAAAGKLTVDKWRVLYTLNYELLVGPNQRPEPSVSQWATHG
ncbi:MAG: hypothetical protein ACREJU_14655, partial [Nitrospiraceae bacterium]